MRRRKILVVWIEIDVFIRNFIKQIEISVNIRNFWTEISVNIRIVRIEITLTIRNTVYVVY